MTTGIASKAAVVFEEAADASTTGIICTTVVYAVPNMVEVCGLAVQIWRRKVEDTVRAGERLLQKRSLPWNLYHRRSSRVVHASTWQWKERPGPVGSSSYSIILPQHLLFTGFKLLFV